MKTQTFVNADHPILQAFHAGCVEKYFGGEAVYRKGQALAAAHERKRQVWTWTSLAASSVLIIAIVALAWVFRAPFSGLGALFLVSYATAATRGLMRANLFAEWGELTNPPPYAGSGPKRDWSKVPVTAFKAADGLFSDFEKIFEIADALGTFTGCAPESLVELGKSLEQIARPAHARVEEIQRGSLAGEGELERLKELLRLCALWGHRLLGLIWEEAGRKHRADSRPLDGRIPTLIHLAPFSWPGFPRGES